MSGFHLLRTPAPTLGDRPAAGPASVDPEASGLPRLSIMASLRSRETAEASSVVVIPEPMWRARADRPRRDELSRRLGLQVRRILSCVDMFRRQCELRGETSRLIDALAGVIESARSGFELAVKLRAGRANPPPQINDDEQRCVHDLDRLMLALRRGAPLLAHDLEHAMDALIMQCVRMDGVDAARRPQFSSPR